MSTFRMSERCAGVASLQEWKVSAVLQKKSAKTVYYKYMPASARRRSKVARCGRLEWVDAESSYYSRARDHIAHVRHFSSGA